MRVKNDPNPCQGCGRLGAVIGYHGNYVCACPVCSSIYIMGFCCGNHQADGLATEVAAVTRWNRDNPLAEEDRPERECAL